MNQILRAFIFLDEHYGSTPLAAARGFTLSVKDNIDVVGFPASAGASWLQQSLPTQHATAIARLPANVKIVGKANLAELAFGARTFSSVGGQCINPWNTEHSPGGSSGGSAVSIAANLCRASLGTDTGGSIRVPAAFNNICGLRPTFGRISNTGVLPVSEYHDTIGPMAKTVTDVAWLYEAIAGYDPLDPHSVNTPVEPVLSRLTHGVQGLRIGIPKNYYFDNANQDVVTAVMAAATTLEQAGATLIDVSIPAIDDVSQCLSQILFAEMWGRFRERLETAPNTMDPSIAARIRLGEHVSGSDYATAMACKARFKHGLQSIYGMVDVLLSPTSPHPAPSLDDGKNMAEAVRSMTRNTYMASMASTPALSIPCGFTHDGLPIGLQLEAAWWQEALLLRAGFAFQDKTAFHKAEPNLSALFN
ncbi:amidase [Alcaligenaceae bacterium]|nr:amidase [Alcaligenaceae bacterium]